MPQALRLHFGKAFAFYFQCKGKQFGGVPAEQLTLIAWHFHLRF
jgi:hypothetical protein